MGVISFGDDLDCREIELLVYLDWEMNAGRFVSYLSERFKKKVDVLVYSYVLGLLARL